MEKHNQCCGLLTAHAADQRLLKNRKLWYDKSNNGTIIAVNNRSGFYGKNAKKSKIRIMFYNYL